LTVSPEAPPLSFVSLDDAISELRRRGMRLSTTRRLVLEALFAADGPISALQVAQLLAIDLASVYRNFEVLERQGLIRHIHLGHGPGLYVLHGRHELEYLYCESCARVTPLGPGELDPLREHLKDKFGYEVSFTHFALVGLCAKCARTQRQRPRREAHTYRAG
jgi:Fur family ferric uptake transcriptional regulator